MLVVVVCTNDCLFNLKTHNHVEEDGYYHSCSIHSLNLVLSNTITKYFGTGGVKNHNSLQLLFTCHALER